MIIIGEKINSSIKQVNDAITTENKDVIKEIAKLQIDAGADYLDVNAGTFLDEEVNKLKWLIETVRECTNKPLVIDSPNPEVIREALTIYTGPEPIINSISLEKNRFEPIINILSEYNAKVVALLMDDSGIPSTTDKRLEIAEELVKELNKNGVNNEDIFIDPLIKPLATSSEDVMSALETIEELRRLYPDIHIVCGLSNVSYGLPARRIINRAFLVAAMTKGLDSAILDPLDKDLMAIYYAADALLGNDEYCMEYITKYREGEFN